MAGMEERSSSSASPSSSSPPHPSFLISSPPPALQGKNEIGIRNETLQLEDREPRVGMVFHSEDEAYEFYNLYAKHKGFSVRKSTIARRKDGSIRHRILLCSNEGRRRKHTINSPKNPRALERTDCMSRIEFKVDREGLWTVVKFISEHNHLCISPNKAHMLRSHRKILPAQREVIDKMENSGIGPSQAYGYMIEEAQGMENVGFILMDQSNYLRTKRMRELEKGDAQLLLDFLKSKQLEDPSFFYALQLDSEGQLTNFLWSDGQSITDYAYFGAVVSFDTTYQTNKYAMPFAPFIGVNHHKQSVVFGGALLLDETTETFVWLFNTFKFAMSGKQPKTIFTDQCAAMSKAIGIAFPNTHHRLCLWYIYQNAAKNLSHVYNTMPTFQKDFKNCVNESGSEDDFLSGWNTLLDKYGLVDNKWLNDLYAIREKWAWVYRRESFCAGMTTTQRSEGMNRHFKRFFNRKLSLSNFIKQYQRSLIRFRSKELYEDFKSRGTKPILLSDIPMLCQAAEAYTRTMYKVFHNEFKNHVACVSKLVGITDSMYTYHVSHTNKRSIGFVSFSPENCTITCNCKKFESMGILCMHALKILICNNIILLPSHYILNRWMKYAKCGSITNQDESNGSNSHEPLVVLYNRVCRQAMGLAMRSARCIEGLKTFERILDQATVEVEEVMRNAVVNTVDEAAGVSDSRQGKESQATIDGLEKECMIYAPPIAERGRRGSNRRILNALEKKKKNKGKNISELNDSPCNPTKKKRRKGKSENSCIQMMLKESSHITSHDQKREASNYKVISSSGCGSSGYNSLPQDLVIQSQNSSYSSRPLKTLSRKLEFTNDTG